MVRVLWLWIVLVVFRLLAPGFAVDTPSVPENIVPPATDYTAWLRVDHEPGFGQTSAFGLRSLGPVLTLRHYLTDLQWQQLNAGRTEDRVIVRFEVIDAHSRVYPGSFPDQPQPEDLGFVVRAILYWAQLDAGSTSPILGDEEDEAEVESRMRAEFERLMLKRENGGTPEDALFIDSENGWQYSLKHGLERRPIPLKYGRTISVQGTLWYRHPLPRQGWQRGQVGPHLINVEIQTVDYSVTPTEALCDDNGIVLGHTGWAVSPEGRVISEEIVQVEDNFNTVVPFYDLSVLSLPSHQVLRGRLKPDQ